MTTTIEQIKEALKAHIAEAEEANIQTVETMGKHLSIDESLWINLKYEEKVRFIAHARTMSPAACKCLLLAIEGLEDISPDVGSGIFADAALESIRLEWHNLTTK